VLSKSPSYRGFGVVALEVPTIVETPVEPAVKLALNRYTAEQVLAPGQAVVPSLEANA
jgi:hypothetical protein